MSVGSRSPPTLLQISAKAQRMHLLWRIGKFCPPHRPRSCQQRAHRSQRRVGSLCSGSCDGCLRVAFVRRWIFTGNYQCNREGIKSAWWRGYNHNSDDICVTVFFLRALISIFLYAHTSAIHTPQLTCIVAQEFYVCKPYCAYLKTFFAHFFSNVKTIPRFLCNIHNLMRCSLRKKQLKKPYFFGQRSEKIQRYTKLSSAFCKSKPSPSHFAKKRGGEPNAELHSVLTPRRFGLSA